MSNLENMKKTISTRIKDERKSLGINQSELAKKIGKSLSTVSGYEVGDALPPVETLYQLADIFSCSTDYLLGRSPHRDYRIDEVDDNKGKVYKVGVHKDSPRKATLDDVMQLLEQINTKK